MRALITGANGQVGQELQRSAPLGISVIALDKQSLDICDSSLVDRVVREFKPQVIVNAAAYAAVDKAEGEQSVAYAVNRDGAANVGLAAAAYGARLIHISTDFVFDGKKSSPYLPGDAPNPLNVYGASKLGGELSVHRVTEGRALILRTAWVYSSTGNNFVKTMLRLLKERDELRVVSDQVGSPTWARGLAKSIWNFVTAKQDAQGIYHWTDAGVASWYDFAVAIQELGIQRGLLHKERRIIPITSADYPAPALRPSYSVLCKMQNKDTMCHWRVALDQMLCELEC